jgi:hypothetical protein
VPIAVSQNDAVASARTVLSTAGNGHPPFQPEAADLPERLRSHDLRHTYAAFCIASTANPYAVMRRMGHSSITVTYNIHRHLSRSATPTSPTGSKTSTAVVVWTSRERGRAGG